MLFRKAPSPAALVNGFFDRYRGRTLIVHRGFSPGWLEELLKQPGGGGHFRVDVRPPAERRLSPVEWVAREQVLPLDLPLPLLIVVRDDTLLLRHLTRAGLPVHPSEILWFLDEIDTRYHARLRRGAEGFESEYGIDIKDNEPEAMFGL